MFFFKPNIEKLIEKNDIQGLIKALDYKDENVRNKAASALIGIGKPEAVDPIVKILDGWTASRKRNTFLFLCQEYGMKNEVVKGVAQGLHFPDKYSKDTLLYDGKSVDDVIKKLSVAMERIPFLTVEQIILEYEYLKQSSGWETNPLLGDTPRGLQSGLVNEAKKAIRKQLNADEEWLTSSRTSYELRSGGWETLILTKYTRDYVVLAYQTKLWQTSQDDGKVLYFYSFSPERNW